MNRIYYFGLAGLALFEIAHVYCIMPMPGSQRMDSLDLAYFLHQWRWVFRGIFGVMIAVGLVPSFRTSRWWALGALDVVALIFYVFNFYMAADAMFLQPQHLQLADRAHNTVKPEKLVLGLSLNGESKAYPIQFLGYHHQVQDQIGGRSVIVTYCTVCRTGRVYAPEINGKPETFRLVGMDHFNAMLEDATTGSWWRQATGEAVAGPLRGMFLPEIPCAQMALSGWLDLHPESQIMQPDPAFQEDYDDLSSYDLGIGRGELTRTDTLSWQDKSWVVGLDIKREAKAYDWNRLKQERHIEDVVGAKPVLLILGSDNKSFFAFERLDASMHFSLRQDTLWSNAQSWRLDGKAISPATGDLRSLKAYQEFWHSWRTFHPGTGRY